MTQPDGYARPLLDPAVLERLRDELEDDESVWKVFVEDFIAQLPQRLQRVRLTLTTGDAKGAMDAILSLKTSSQDPAVALPLLAANHLRRIKQCAQRTINVLQNHLQQGP